MNQVEGMMMEEVSNDPKSRPTSPKRSESPGYFQLKQLGEFLRIGLSLLSVLTAVLHSIDIYTKIHEEFRVQTSGGALCKLLLLLSIRI